MGSYQCEPQRHRHVDFPGLGRFSRRLNAIRNANRQGFARAKCRRWGLPWRFSAAAAQSSEFPHPTVPFGARWKLGDPIPGYRARIHYGRQFIQHHSDGRRCVWQYGLRLHWNRPFHQQRQPRKLARRFHAYQRRWNAFAVTLKTAGAITITATDTASSNIKGTSANIAVSPGAPSSVAAPSGSAQSTGVNNSYQTLSVTVTDQYGNPLPGLTVTFTAPSSGPSVTFFSAGATSGNLVSPTMSARPSRPNVPSGVSATAITNSQGIASINVTANNIPGAFTVTASVAGMTIPFTLTNMAPALNPHVDPSFLTLQYIQAGPNAAPTGPTMASLGVNGAFTSPYSASFNAPWLSVTPTSGLIGGSVTVAANGSALQPGIYSTAVTFAFADGSTIAVPVQLTVIGPPLFKASAASLTFVAQAGSTAIQTQSFNIQSAGANFTAALTVADIQGGGGSWLTITPSSIATAAAVQAQVNPIGLAAGVYQKNIVATASGVGNSPFTIPVTLTVTSPPPVIGVLAWSMPPVSQPAQRLPNTIATAFGTFPGCSANAQVMLDGTAASVFYSSPAQISFLIPASVSGENSANAQVSCAGLTAPAMAIPIAAAAPSLFSVSQNGTGQAAVVNQDGTVNTPSPAGTVIQLFGTGFGAYGPMGSDGLTRLSQTVTATVGGVAAQVMYAGQAPGYTPGLQQIDILIPAGAPKGQAVPLQLSVGPAVTQTGLTLMVQ